MALDPSIYFQSQPVQVPDQLNKLAAIGQIQQQQNANRLAQLQFDKATQDEAIRTGTNKAYADAFDPATGKIDYSKVQGNLANSGLGSAIPTVAKSAAETQKVQLEAQKAQVEQGLQHLQVAGQLMAGVTDQPSLDAARAQAVKLFGEDAAANIPAVYDPAVIDANKLKALSLKDQLEQHWKQLDYDQKGQSQAETVRHNRSTEATAQGNLGVAQAGLRLRRQELAQGKVPAGYRQLPNGDLQAIPGGPAEKEKNLTETQGKATGFAARMQDANKIISQYDGKVSPSAVAAASGVSPSWLPGGSVIDAASNYAVGKLSPEAQKYAQAQENWVTANLRLESGAVIGEQEKAQEIKKWFPQPGDTPDNIAQKAAARKVAERSMLIQAGPGAKQIPQPSSAPSSSSDGWSVTEVK